MSQDFPDFELLVVDDGSTDDSVAVVEGFRDSRIRVFREGRNRGPCPARNSGIAQATGKWLVMLDSDFELLPGALHCLHGRTEAAAPDVGKIASSCVWDTGHTTPIPAVDDTVFDYIGFLRWIETLEASEYFNCFRREVFRAIRYPDSRAWEFELHLDVARDWKLDISREPLVKIHTDAPNRLTTDRGPRALQRIREDAPDKLRSYQTIFEQHGAAMDRWAPRLLDHTRVRAGHQALLSGRRLDGLRLLLHTFRKRRPSSKELGLLFVGLVGPGVTARATLHMRRTI